MKTFEEDIEIKQLLQSINLDKPSLDFRNKVMNRVFEEKAVFEQVKAEPLFGKGFWIIVALFGVLLISIAVIGSVSTESSSILPDFNLFKLLPGYRSLLDNLDKLPASIAGIAIAFSLLVFLDKFLGSKRQELA